MHRAWKVLDRLAGGADSMARITETVRSAFAHRVTQSVLAVTDDYVTRTAMSCPCAPPDARPVASLVHSKALPTALGPF